MRCRSFRLLACAFEVATDDNAVFAALELLVPHAQQDYPLTRSHRLEVRLRDGRYELSQDGAYQDHEWSPEYAVRAVAQRVHALALAALPGAVIARAGSGTHQGRRFLMAGPSHAGMSTLLTALLGAGTAALSDRFTVLQDRAATPFPRRFRLMESSLAHLAELAPAIRAMPFVADEIGRRTYSFDPAQAGFAWRIETGVPAVLFLLDPNHGGQTRLEPCSRLDALELLSRHALRPGTSAQTAQEQFASLVHHAECYVLHHGEVAAGVSLLQSFLST